MPAKLGSRLAGYALALLTVGVAWALTMALGPLVRQNQLVLFVMAVMVSSWYVGLGPGLFATALSTLAINFFFRPPLYIFSLDSEDAERLSLFLVVALGINALNEARKRVAARLRHSERLFRSLVQGIHDYGIFMLDPQGKVLTWSSGAGQIQGYSTSQIVGQDFGRFYPPEDQADGKPERVLRQAVARGQFEEEGWWARPDGVRYWAGVLITPLHDVEQRLTGFSVVLRDLTGKRKLEEQMEQRQASLAHLARVSTLNELASGIAHELNQPLSAIRLFSQGVVEKLAGTPGIDADVKQAAQAIVGQAARASQIINHYQALARRREPQRREIDPAAIIRSALELTDYEIRRHAIAFDLRLAPDLPRVWGDEVQIEQVLINLLKNGIEAVVAGPHLPRTLAVRAWADDEGRLTVEVVDNGQGLRAEVLARVLEPFYTTKDRGLGLGLPISRSIIEAHGGHLTVESIEGVGTTVRFWLPTVRTLPGGTA